MSKRTSAIGLREWNGLGPRASLLGSLVVALVGCSDGGSGGDRDRTLVVHSSLPSAVLDHAEAAFEAAFPDVDVRVVASTPEETLAAVREGEPVDVWWGAPVTVLEAAADEGRLQAHRPSWTNELAIGGDPEGRWHPSLVSPFVIAFNRERLPIMQAPTEWNDLFHHRLWGEVLLPDPRRSSEMAYFVGAMLVEALRDDDDLLRGFDWHGRLDRSNDEYLRDTGEIVRRLGSGDALLTILPRYVVERARHDRAPWIHYRLPESGTPLLALGIAITASASDVEAARAFVDLTGGSDLATVVQLHTRWSPASGDVDRADLPPDFELNATVRTFPLAADTIARELAGWLDRWDVDVRGRGAL
jgi:iron(III) transport system substrate-binding protein